MTLKDKEINLGESFNKNNHKFYKSNDVKEAVLEFKEFLQYHPHHMISSHETYDKFKEIFGDFEK